MHPSSRGHLSSFAPNGLGLCAWLWRCLAHGSCPIFFVAPREQGLQHSSETPCSQIWLETLDIASQDTSLICPCLEATVQKSPWDRLKLFNGKDIEMKWKLKLTFWSINAEEKLMRPEWRNKQRCVCWAVLCNLILKGIVNQINISNMLGYVVGYV